ncbi:hypothetical protein V0288_02505 [Pannus brasiliensis CCIBt3594]|uniref:Uncharacterized protein n=1 Tax=Pannus brasiliensis CCIBt3594 TaxID=1427578 RepID=A0AAW9QR89_9CHRO
MLIKIDRSLTENLNEEIVEALRYLAIAIKEGKHKVIAKKETLKPVLECADLSANERAIYQKLYNSVEFNANLQVVSKYIEVLEPCPEPKLELSGGKQIIKVPARFFNDSAKIQKTILLCEHDIDTKFYEIIVKVFRVWKQLKSVPIDYTPIGAGGSLIAIEYQKNQNSRKNLCLCIVDSDRLSPSANLGGTAQKIQEIDDINLVFTQLIILKVRAVENLIPNSILSEVCQSNRERSKALEILESITDSSGIEVRNFLHLKEGSKFFHLANSSNQAIKKFWQEKLGSIPTLSSRIAKECIEDWKCNVKKDECECYIFSGFGAKLLEDSIEWLKKQDPHKIAQMVDTDLRTEWEYLGQQIVDWCFASSPIRG